VSAITERKTFLTVMARLLPITIKTAPPLKKVLTVGFGPIVFHIDAPEALAA
jgi:hypothetical protein